MGEKKPRGGGEDLDVKEVGQGTEIFEREQGGKEGDVLMEERRVKTGDNDVVHVNEEKKRRGCGVTD